VSTDVWSVDVSDRRHGSSDEDTRRAIACVEEGVACDWKVQERTRRAMQVGRSVKKRRWGRSKGTYGCGRWEEATEGFDFGK